MKIKKFIREYCEKDWHEVTEEEETLYEFCLDMKEMEEKLEVAISKYEHGEATAKDAYTLIDSSACVLIDANQFLCYMVKGDRK